ncbi:MAG: helix-turn-helix domain-containing protein [Phormidesmis sp. RL_2_1]|nr:helix-turn-helix domain-containing protein [Phormidesmis sp. RL_2_1]
MVYTIKNGCHDCDSCQPQCIRGAIKPSTEREGYWIDPTLCDSCSDIEIPRCVQVCDSGTSLEPLQSKKGRCKSTLLPPAIPSIFLDGKTTPFASCMVIWEASTVLSQRQLLPWQSDDDGKLCYYRPVNRGRGEIRFRLDSDPEAELPVAMRADEARGAIASFDIRAACIHLIFAAYAVTLDSAWESSFELNDQHIEKYLGLDRRKDLTKLEKLTLIKDLIHQACRLLISLDWPRQGKVQPFVLSEQPIWQLLDTQYYFEEDAQGCQHLIGLSFTVRAGQWAQHFLNSRDYRRQTAFYQYGRLPHSLITAVMGSWQQHEGAVRLLLWLLFKLRLGGDHRLTVRTLLRVAYGETRLQEATTVRGAHKRLLKTFERDLETLYCYGLKPSFDPQTYPIEIQPLWAKAASIPNNAEENLAFWADDASRMLTDNAPRDKWQRLLNARILGFELSADWQQAMGQPKPKRRRKPRSATIVRGSTSVRQLSGDEIKAAREQGKISQRALADCMGKSQSWIRDIEKGRFSMSAEDQGRLRQVLKIQ